MTISAQKLHRLSPCATRFCKEKLKRVALGACFLASGGGGMLESAMNLLDSFPERGCSFRYYPRHYVEVVNIDDIDEADEGYISSAAYVCAPAAVKVGSFPDEPVQAVLQLKKRLAQEGKELKYIVPMETGALSTITACLVAAHLGLKVINADGAGRAVPSLPSLPLAYTEGLSPSPFVVCNTSQGLCIETNINFLSEMNTIISNKRELLIIADNMLRAIISNDIYKNFGGLALWLMDVPQIKKAQLIAKTVSKAYEIGGLIMNSNTAEDLVNKLNTYPLIPNSISSAQGKVKLLFGPGRLEIPENKPCAEGEGFDFGKILIKKSTSESCTILYQNESLIAYVLQGDIKKVLQKAPDSIAYFMEDANGAKQKVFSNGDLLQNWKSTPDFRNKTFSLIGLPGDSLLKENQDIVDTFDTMINNLNEKV